MDEKVVLYINLSNSRCGNCNGGALTSQIVHDTEYGYSKIFPRPGCGAKFTHVSSDYLDHNGLYDSIMASRPDLIPEFMEIKPYG